MFISIWQWTFYKNEIEIKYTGLENRETGKYKLKKRVKGKILSTDHFDTEQEMIDFVHEENKI